MLCHLSFQTFLIMKTYSIYAICSIIITLNLYSCQKENLSFTPEIQISDAVLLQDGASDRGPQADFAPCGLQDSNSVSITYRLKNGSMSPALCFTESELLSVMVKAGLNPTEAQKHLKSLFYTSESADPALARYIGTLISKGYPIPNDYMNNCFIVSAFGRQDYPLDAVPAAPKYATGPVVIWNGNPKSGFIDFYTIRQAISGSGCNLIRESGFTGVRFLNTVTRATKTVNIPSLDSLRMVFNRAGFSPTDTETTMTDLMNGKISIRSVWEMYQKQLVPALPTAKKLKLQADARDWRLSQIGIGLYASDASIESFYYAKGDARIE